MATTADFRKGMCLEYNNDLFTIVHFEHSKSGRGAAFVRTKLKSLTTGKIKENTFSAKEKVTEARIEHRPYQYLYKDDLGYHFMNIKDYEQTHLPEVLIENADLFKENQEVEIVFHAETEKALTCYLPSFIELEISYTEPGVKGDTASSTVTKPATLETGAEIRVPLFINKGDVIKIDTRTREYSERIK
ncbi:MAG: elongation factor P [Bacteroidota bacterium]|nr:elongation factor P [Bacteroidota bacterium]